MGVDVACFNVRTLIGHNLAEECYLMTVIALLYKHKISLLGMVCCFDPTGNEGRHRGLLSFLKEQSFSNVCVTFPPQASTQALSASLEISEISKRMQQD